MIYQEAVWQHTGKLPCLPPLFSPALPCCMRTEHFCLCISNHSCWKVASWRVCLELESLEVTRFSTANWCTGCQALKLAAWILCLQIQSIVSKGQLVPDEIIFKVRAPLAGASQRRPACFTIARPWKKKLRGCDSPANRHMHLCFKYVSMRCDLPHDTCRCYMLDCLANQPAVGVRLASSWMVFLALANK